MERWSRSFRHRGAEYSVEFVKRPFREGLEVTLHGLGDPIRLGELGLGEKAIMSRLKTEIDKRTGTAKTD